MLHVKQPDACRPRKPHDGQVYKDKGLPSEAVVEQHYNKDNGQVGEDITVNLRTLRALPKRIPIDPDSGLTPPPYLVVRGEAFLPLDEFEALNERRLANGEAAYMNPTAYGDFTGLNWVVWAVGRVFGDQKFMTLFSILFGAGVVLLTERLERRGVGSAALYYRRTLWLLAIGFMGFYFHIAHALMRRLAPSFGIDASAIATATFGTVAMGLGIVWLVFIAELPEMWFLHRRPHRLVRDGRCPACGHPVRAAGVAFQGEQRGNRPGNACSGGWRFRRGQHRAFR